MNDEPTTGGSPGDGRRSDRPRVPTVTEREEVPHGGEHYFDDIVESRGSVRGPFSVLMHCPELAARVADLGAYVRFQCDVDGRLRELAILATAYEWDCAYEWAAHEPIAREEGVGATEINVLTGRAPSTDLDESAAIVVRYVRELLRDHDVTDGTYRAAMDHFGDRGVVELTTTIGYYSMLACVLNALRVLPDEPPGPF